MIISVARAALPRGWVCASCVLRRATPFKPVKQKRWLSAVSQQEPTSPTKPAPAIRVQGKEGIANSTSDADLRDIFDNPQAWVGFTDHSSPNSGLFRNRYLRTPAGFLQFANISLARAQSIVDKVLGASTLEGYRTIVRDLDRLSDILCRVLDMTDFVRVTHPDRKTQEMASVAYEQMYEYMNQLNTMTGLSDQLDKALENPEVTSSWSQEERVVAEALKLDFAKSAVSLPKAARDRFVELSSEISRVGSDFIQEMAPAQDHVFLPTTKLMGMDPVEVHKLARRGMVHLRTLSPAAAAALRTVRDKDARKHLFYASRTAANHTVAQLETLMRLRGELAALSGFESYGHLTLRDRMMARTPEAVTRFLQALASSNKPIAQAETVSLFQQKRLEHPATRQLEPWDKDFYAETIRRSMTSKASKYPDTLSSYFSLGVVIQGISRILTRLYGIRLVPRKTTVGETWHQDVRRLDVISDTDGHIAVLYCDLFYRPAKSPNPAHFTLRCSREIFEPELAEVGAQVQGGQGMPQFESPELAATDGMAFSRQGNAVKQLPTIALICDFQQPHPKARMPTLLSFYQVETLFHEMGHAVHSILARTSFQNVSGTRCATDLAELPSTLMEYFAADPAVLSQFARHYKTDEPLPYELLADKLRRTRRFEGLETENQIILAMLDQELHSNRALRPEFDSSDIYHNLQYQFSSAPPDPPNTKWQGFFGHLSGYGSTYYSYLFDRVLAQRVWNVVFKAGHEGASLERENGERLKEGLLKWGGGRDPWNCLSDVLKDERLMDGGESAMELVGSWGSSGQGQV
ncbi:hypothetical protein QBC34DRAFT_409355 [Podospora aff. communis PSN243]|uniref:Mitochondrial intermediate peptidase n=1 Tax=Podospora aff. communis PSN243 TaxID=3040156 RepID=A0AAV9GGQ7_9PEZI|nr:hypothetical protein QBC34DRAFT_409355 [Podospora aff. communis PSN243]